MAAAVSGASGAESLVAAAVARLEAAAAAAAAAKSPPNSPAPTGGPSSDLLPPGKFWGASNERRLPRAGPPGSPDQAPTTKAGW